MNRFKRLVSLLVLATSVLTVTSKPSKRHRYDAEFLDSEIQRVRSGKVGQDMEPVWTVSKGTTVAPLPQETTDEGKDESATEEDYYGSSEELEITCAPGKGWHMRGNRCVTINCPGGPAERDFNTGECLYSHQPKGRYNRPFTQWNDLNHVYRSSPMSSHLVRSMVMMRKG